MSWHYLQEQGGGILGGHLCGWKTVAAVEIEEYPRAVLLQRQLDGILPRFPIWDDVCTFDGKPWRGKIDVISGGFPCQDISAAGKGAGITGERSGLWSEMARIIGEVRPRFCLVENSPMLTSRGLGTVLGDLAEMGYDARWCVLGAVDAGAPHKRERIWILAYANSSGSNKDPSLCELRTDRLKQSPKNQRVANAGKIAERSERVRWWDSDPADIPHSDKTGFQTEGPEQQAAGIINIGTGEEWPIKPELGRVAHGVAHRVDRLKAIGNGQVPAVAALAWEILTKDII